MQWDFISLAALFFTAICTPIEVCFVADGEVGWFVVNFLVPFALASPGDPPSFPLRRLPNRTPAVRRSTLSSSWT